MKYCKILSTALLALAVSSTVFSYPCSTLCDDGLEWDFITYMQADNNLVPYSSYNVDDMETVGSTPQVNVFVQLDTPTAKNPSRYKIVLSDKIAQNKKKKLKHSKPDKALKDLMKWTYKTYPAPRYALILWDHGNGVLDRSNKWTESSWLRLLGSAPETVDRGILYDYSKNTFLNNKGLNKTCKAIKKDIKQNIDLLGMDANLMSMIEVAYEIKDSVNYMVSSQQTEPGFGWPYSNILRVLTSMPHLSTGDFAAATVAAYRNFYMSNGNNADSSFTLSAIDLSRVQAATIAFNAVLQAITLSQSVNKQITNAILQSARKNTMSFYVPSYIDLIDWYDNLTASFTQLAYSLESRYCSVQIGPDRASIVQAANAILATVAAAKCATKAVVVASAAGSDYNGKAHGLSIYYPENYFIDESYKKTSFAKNTYWLSFLKSLTPKP